MMEKDANAQAPTKPEGANLRGADRDEVFLRTLMSCDHRNGIGGQLVNISPRGFMVRTLEAFTNGSRIS